jgi:hypothetical protein
MTALPSASVPAIGAIRKHVCTRRSAWRIAGVPAILALATATSSCTIAKPIIGALAAPFVILGNSGGAGGCGCDGDGRGWLCAFAFMMAVGAVCGLVTGVVSDVQYLTGAATDPTANWYDPFKTNTSKSE